MNIHLPKHQFIKDDKGKKSHVIIAFDEFENFIDSLKSDEELYDESLKDDSEAIPLDVVEKLLEVEKSGEKLRIWREYRALTQATLATKAGLKTGQYIYELEASRRKGPIDTWRALAKALNIEIDELL